MEAQSVLVSPKQTSFFDLWNNFHLDMIDSPLLFSKIVKDFTQQVNQAYSEDRKKTVTTANINLLLEKIETLAEESFKELEVKMQTQEDKFYQKIDHLFVNKEDDSKIESTIECARQVRAYFHHRAFLQVQNLELIEKIKLAELYKSNISFQRSVNEEKTEKKARKIKRISKFLKETKENKDEIWATLERLNRVMDHLITQKTESEKKAGIIETKMNVSVINKNRYTEKIEQAKKNKKHIEDQLLNYGEIFINRANKLIDLSKEYNDEELEESKPLQEALEEKILENISNVTSTSHLLYILIKQKELAENDVARLQVTAEMKASDYT